MKTLRFSLTAVTLALASLPSFAVDPVTTPPAVSADTPDRPMLRRLAQRRHAERARLAERLGLSADQQEQLKSKRASVAASAKAIREDASLTTEEKKARLREMRQTTQAEMRALLTPDQQAKLDTMKKRAHRGAHRRTSL